MTARALLEVRMVRARWLGVVLGAGLAGCGGDPVPRAVMLEVVPATDEQVGVAGGRLASPLAVMALAEDGSAVARARVQWFVTAGTGATLADSVTLSDGTGRAEVVLTLGPEPGIYQVQARLADRAQAAVGFAALAVAAPKLTGVLPSAFTGGDTVILSGTNLSDTTIVEFAGVRATVVGAQALGRGLAVVVPVCLVPGSVPIVVGLGTARSSPITGTYQASAYTLNLAPGEYFQADASVLEGCAVFPRAGLGGAEYLLAAQAATGTPGLSGDYELRGNLAAAPVPVAGEPAAGLPLKVRFHDQLRAMEARMARLPRPPVSEEQPLPADVAAIQVGSQRQFKVCKALPCTEEAQFTKATARAKFVGKRSVLYLDVSAPADGLSDAELEEIGRRFDEELYPLAALHFGAESDLDRNGLVFVLMTPLVNGLTPKATCEESVIDAFFYPADVDPRFKGTVFSNQAEVFYTVAADPQGSVTCAISLNFVRRQVPATLIHELQHMISYNQHVLLRGGDVETLWLNEALAHLASEIGGLYYLEQGDTARFSSFAIGNVFNAYQYLSATGSHFVLPGEGGGSIAERGAAWLFVRWIVDQFGDLITRRLVETRLTGAENVAAATGEPFARLVGEWFLTPYVNDLPDFDTPPRLQYRRWRFRRTYEALNQQAPELFPTPFPLEPLQASGGAFAFSGVLHSGSGQLVRVLQDPGANGFTVRLSGLGGEPLSASLGARVNVIRIR